MKIYFKSKAIQKICNNGQQAIKKYGPQMARELQQRLMELLAAPCLRDMAKLPHARCHELTGGKRAGQLSVDLKFPNRLIFFPADDPPRKTDGGLDWDKVTAITIIEIANTHSNGR